MRGVKRCARGLLVLSLFGAATMMAQTGARGSEWHFYGGDAGIP